jgi:tagatose-6-phosphate ketose/aldose isomerase
VITGQDHGMTQEWNAPDARLLGHSLADLRTAGGSATASEIVQQPGLWRECVQSVGEKRSERDDFLAPLLVDPRTRIILTGAGTSAFIGEVLAPSLTRSLGRRVDAIATTDLVSNPQDHLTDDVPTLLVSFARSGDSPESLAATRLADQFLSQVRHLIITCNPAGALAAERAGSADTLVVAMPAAANDAGFAMTSSFTCMLLTAQLLLTGPDVPVEKLAAAADRALAVIPSRAAQIAGAGFERVVYLGSGPLQGLARESALKLLELTAGRVAAWFDSPLGFRHGPKALVNDRTLVVVLTSSDPYTRRYDDDIVAELGPRLTPGGLVVVSSDESPSNSPDAQVWSLPEIDGLDDALRAVVLALPAQILALQMSLAHGLTPDNPFPDGEVNRVVEGVRIHPAGQIGKG